MALLYTVLFVFSFLHSSLGQIRASRPSDATGTAADPITDYVYYDEPVDAGPDIPEHAVQARPGEFPCPTGYGDFADPVQCDKYWRCKTSVAYSILCPDGLVFDISKADGRDSPCESPYVVDCKDKKKLQDPTFPHPSCPRRFGYFADPDPRVCNIYFNCNDGVAIKTTCSTTLHFDETTGTCAWPNVANRKECAAPVRDSINGFTCPLGESLSAAGVVLPHPTFPNNEDCQKFYVCLNGEVPQEASCTLGKVFDERTRLCGFPENVPECVGWYKEDERFADYYYDNPTVGVADPGAQDVAA